MILRHRCSDAEAVGLNINGSFEDAVDGKPRNKLWQRVIAVFNGQQPEIMPRMTTFTVAAEAVEARDTAPARKGVLGSALLALSGIDPYLLAELKEECGHSTNQPDGEGVRPEMRDLSRGFEF